MNIRYRVDLSDEERTQLAALLSGAKHAARKIKRAQILLAADARISDLLVAGFRWECGNCYDGTEMIRERRAIRCTMQ